MRHRQCLRIWVNRLSDGAELGVFDPGPTVGGVANTGWIDLLTGINAFRCRDGEYLVFVEESCKAKGLIYWWRPDASENARAVATTTIRSQ